jgi:hypothetical protein
MEIGIVGGMDEAHLRTTIPRMAEGSPILPPSSLSVLIYKDEIPL